MPDTRTSSSSTNTTHVLVHGGLLAIDQLAPPPAVTAVVLDPTGGRAPRLIGGALHHRFGHQLNRIPQRTSIFHWILITGGVVVTNAQDDENSPTGTAVVGCCCCLDLGTTPTRPRMRHVPLRLAEHPSALLLASVLVYHCALSLPLTVSSSPEQCCIALVGGGAAGFYVCRIDALGCAAPVDKNNNNDSGNRKCKSTTKIIG